ncbi:MAG TPA: exosortase K [Kofleriaceae bacterium]|nr:exosortase K [Kofleriaceae bacterium]
MTFVKEHRWRIVAVLVAAAVVALGKQFYRDASAADLRWILAPTAKLVSWFTGGHFTYESGAGYADYHIGFIIAPPCAGLNFAMAAFLTLLLGSLAVMTSMRALAVRVAVAGVAAYLATIVVNTIRISIAVAMHRGSIDIGSMDRAEAHRLEGILVYLGGLCLLYALARAIESGKRHVTFAIPIAAYLVITLGLPLVNGAGARGEFAHHAMWVLMACAVVMALAFVIDRHVHRRTA